MANVCFLKSEVVITQLEMVYYVDSQLVANFWRLLWQ